MNDDNQERIPQQCRTQLEALTQLIGPEHGVNLVEISINWIADLWRTTGEGISGENSGLMTEFSMDGGSVTGFRVRDLCSHKIKGYMVVVTDKHGVCQLTLYSRM